MMKTAVLMTCHNRKDCTLACLDSLFKNRMPKDMMLDVYLVDDGSNDGTKESVMKNYPMVNIIVGDGTLFWNKGMRLAWSVAEKKYDYNFYLWLNDDVILKNTAILELFECMNTIQSKYEQPALLTGAFTYSQQKEVFSYGGRAQNEVPVIPNGEIQECFYINGNAVIVPNEIYKRIGKLSDDYTHSMGDFDYGLQAIKAGFKCYTTRTYIGTCPEHDEIPGWCNPKISLKERWKLLHSPGGLNIAEYIKFRKKFFGDEWRIYAMKAYVKTIIPRLYEFVKLKQM